MSWPEVRQKQQVTDSLPTSNRTDHSIKAIYQGLIQLGYPKILQTELQKVEDIRAYLSSYFQWTESRVHLIEWLIAVISPTYREQQWHVVLSRKVREMSRAKTCSKEQGEVKLICECLWKLGAMPFNKHTKNLDYLKYAKGQLGFENAVVLLHELVELARESLFLAKSKKDVIFGQFLHDTISSFGELVNESYDVYGITFPCKFLTNGGQTVLSDTTDSPSFEENLQKFEKQYEKFYTDRIQPLLAQEQQLMDRAYRNSTCTNITRCEQGKGTEPEINLTTAIDDLKKYAVQYEEKYQHLVDSIQNVLEDKNTKNRIKAFAIEKQSSGDQGASRASVKENIKKRSVGLSRQFCKKYLSYKATVKSSTKALKQDQGFFAFRTQVLDPRIEDINKELIL